MTLLDKLLLTRSGPKVHPEGDPPGTHVVHGDRSFDYHDADFLLFGVIVEEIRWLQSGVVVPHVTVRPLRRSRHLREWARRERRSQTRHCGAQVLSSVRPSSCGPSQTSAVSGLLRKKGRGCPSRFAVPPASTAPGAAADGPERPHTDLEARLERLFTRGRELAGTLSGPRSKSWRWASSRSSKRTDGNILTMVPDWHNRPVVMQLAFWRARRVQPETTGLLAGRGGEHPLCSRRGLAHTGPQWCALHLPRVLLADLRRGFLVVRSTAYQGEDDGAGRSLP